MKFMENPIGNHKEKAEEAWEITSKPSKNHNEINGKP